MDAVVHEQSTNNRPIALMLWLFSRNGLGQSCSTLRIWHKLTLDLKLRSTLAIFHDEEEPQALAEIVETRTWFSDSSHKLSFS